MKKWFGLLALCMLCFAGVQIYYEANARPKGTSYQVALEEVQLLEASISQPFWEGEFSPGTGNLTAKLSTGITISITAPQATRLKARVQIRSFSETGGPGVAEGLQELEGFVREGLEEGHDLKFSGRDDHGLFVVSVESSAPPSIVDHLLGRRSGSSWAMAIYDPATKRWVVSGTR